MPQRQPTEVPAVARAAGRPSGRVGPSSSWPCSSPPATLAAHTRASVRCRALNRTPSAPLTLLVPDAWVTTGQNFSLRLEAGARDAADQPSSDCRSPSTPACPASRPSTSRCRRRRRGPRSPRPAHRSGQRAAGGAGRRLQPLAAGEGGRAGPVPRPAAPPSTWPRWPTSAASIRRGSIRCASTWWTRPTARSSAASPPTSSTPRPRAGTQRLRLALVLPVRSPPSSPLRRRRRASSWPGRPPPWPPRRPRPWPEVVDTRRGHRPELHRPGDPGRQRPDRRQPCNGPATRPP